MKLDQKIWDAVHAAMGLGGSPADHRVVVAMSGGVDSSVVAALLKVAGYDVVGITLQLYDHGEAIRRKGACCAGQDIHDARRVAAGFDIPHYILDFESRFKDAVINDFVAGYLAGETPIPCVKCNQTVKFADLLQRAKDLDATALVTGHYIESRSRGYASKHRDLFTPADMARDQSYFLFATTQEQIDFLRFPLGALPKAETRRFIDGYKKDTGSDPYNLNGYGYDGLMLVADAIKRAGSTDKDKVRDAMQSTRSYQGVMGGVGASYGFADGRRTGFDTNGMVVRVYEGDLQGKVVHVGQK